MRSQVDLTDLLINFLIHFSEGAPSMSSEMKPRRETEKGTRIKDIKEGVKIMEDGESVSFIE